MDLVAELKRLAGSEQYAISLLESMAAETGTVPDFGNPALVALALCQCGTSPEEVSASLTWREFESFCSELFRASGYDVRENVVLTKPRAQIDMVASGPSFVLSVDCKHWKRAHSPSALRGFARSQLRRSRLLRRGNANRRPIVSVILSFSEPAGAFVDGVAVVPLRTLRSFLTSLESYSDLLAFR